MKYLIFLCISSIILADNSTDNDFVQNIGVVVDKVFEQGFKKLENGEDIVEWLYSKHKEEFKDIENIISDMRVEVGFDRTKENSIKEELQKYLQKKTPDEAQKVLNIDGITPERMQDFFHIPRMICVVIIGSDDVCRRMIWPYKQAYCSDVKKLRIIDKAEMKVQEEEKKQQKKELLHQLREQTILGTSPRK
jgi:hypothetical protein